MARGWISGLFRSMRAKTEQMKIGVHMATTAKAVQHLLPIKWYKVFASMLIAHNEIFGDNFQTFGCNTNLKNAVAIVYLLDLRLWVCLPKTTWPRTWGNNGILLSRLYKTTPSGLSNPLRIKMGIRVVTVNSVTWMLRCNFYKPFRSAKVVKRSQIGCFKTAKARALV